MVVSTLIKALEVELLQPGVRKSSKRLNELIADNFLEIGASGKQYYKKDTIEALMEEDELKFSINNFHTVEIAPYTVLATYEVEKENLESNKILFSTRTSIWKNIDGNWQIIFHQGTTLDK